MGQGIIGTIPLSFRFKKNRWEYHEAAMPQQPLAKVFRFGFG